MKYLKGWGFIIGLCLVLQGCGDCFLGPWPDHTHCRGLFHKVQIPAEGGVENRFVDAEGYQATFELEGEKDCMLTGCGFAKVRIAEGRSSWTYRFPIGQGLGHVALTEDGATLKDFEIASMEDSDVSITGKIGWKEASLKPGAAGDSSSTKKAGLLSGAVRIRRGSKTWLRLVIRNEIPLQNGSSR